VRNLKMGFDPLSKGVFFLGIFLIKIRHKGNEKQGVYQSHYGLAIYIKTYHLKAKDRIMETHKYFTMPKYNLAKKNPLKETKILQDHIINSITINLKFRHKPKYIIFQKSSCNKIDLLLLFVFLLLLLLPRGQNPLSYYNTL
jgi:hypothetical protein